MSYQQKSHPQKSHPQNASPPQAIDHMITADDTRIKCMDYQDFLGALSPRSVDLILTDPPYTISRETGFKAVKNGVQRFAVSMDFGQWDHDMIDLDRCAHLCYRCLRQGGTAIIWYDLWKLTDLTIAMEKAGFRMLRLIIWQKTNPVPLNQRATYLSNSREIAICGVKGSKPTFNSRYDNGMYCDSIPRHGGKKIHPTQKPESLFIELIEKHSHAGDLVIDPFLGSGTTAIAAHKTARTFMGCDIDTTYIQAAKQRLAEVESDV